MSDEAVEVEAKARKQGWLPEEEFKGDPSKCVSAEQFLERGKDINAILRTNNEKLEGSIDKMRTQMSQQQEKFDKFSKHHEDTAKREYARAVADIESRKEDAVKDEDVAAYQKAEQDGQALVKPVEATAAQQEQAPDPAFAPWLANNSWYMDNPEAHKEADEYGSKIQGSGMSAEAFYAAVTGHMKDKRPELFGQPRQNRQQTVETGGGVPATGKKTYSDLPADAKAMCDNFVTDGFLTREQYVKDFDWSEA